MSRKVRVHKHDLRGHAPNNESWPTPLELLDLRDAVNQGKEHVELSGRKFDIFYKENTDEFYVSPVKGFAPCGWFHSKSSFSILDN